MQKLEGSQTGFVVEMGDVNEYGSFEQFQDHIRKAQLRRRTGGKAVTYRTGDDSLGGQLGRLHGERQGSLGLRQGAVPLAGHHAHPDGPRPAGEERRDDPARSRGRTCSCRPSRSRRSTWR